MSRHQRRVSEERYVSVGTAAVPLLPASRTRESVVISCPTTARVTVSARSDVADGLGLVLHPGGSPVKLCCCDVGNWLGGQLYAIASAGTETIGIVESLDYDADSEE